MTEFKKIAVIGAGSWGTALSLCLHRSKLDVFLYARQPELIDEIKKTSFSKYLPNTPIDSDLKISFNKELIKEASLILWVVPTQKTLESIDSLIDYIPSNAPIIICSKGIDLKTNQTLSEIFTNVFNNHVGVLSGPNFADEVAQNLPSATTIAFNNLDLAQKITNTIRSKNFRIYASSDVKGVELHGALKNVMAIAAGIVMGSNLGNNCLYALITRANAEIQRIVEKLGGAPATANTLAGIGDLMLTCSSNKSRNTSLGEQLSLSNSSLSEILSKRISVTEGVATAKAAHEIVKKNNIYAPIINAVYDILYNNISIPSAIEKILSNQQEVE